jgi:hypothetical protein
VPITISVTLDLYEVSVTLLTSPVLKGIERLSFSGPFHRSKHKVIVSTDSLSGPFALMHAVVILEANGT